MEFTEEDILSELSKPLPVNGVYYGETIAERLGIPRTDPNPDDYLKFYKRLDFCIKGKLVELTREWDRKDYETWHDNKEPRTFYMNNLAPKEIEITTGGKLYLAQMKASKAKQTVDIPKPPGAISNITQNVIGNVLAIFIVAGIYKYSGSISSIINNIAQVGILQNGYTTWIVIVVLGVVTYFIFRTVKRYLTESIKRTTKYKMPVAVRYFFGLILIVIGGCVIIYGLQIWQSAYQPNNISVANFTTNAFVKPFESIVLDIIGILLITGGFALINSELTLKVMKFIYENWHID